MNFGGLNLLSPLHIIFYIFAAIAVCSAISVITVRNPVRSVLSLVITFFAMSGIWMILRAEFLSLILLLVYVGAVMTLFLFVVMMLNIDRESTERGFVRYLPFGIVIILLMMGLLLVTVSPQYFGITAMPLPLPEPDNYSNIQHIGEVLFTNYVYPFEIAGVILLVAIIAAITLTHRKPTRRRVQKVSEQLAATKDNRLQIIKMASDPKQGN
jgi:NADH-quinone oxidoreductase subunit J